jgi:hypothetical protein
MNQVVLTARHRKCLQNGYYGGPQGENEAHLYTGAKIRQECLDQGWLERLPDSPAGFRMYRTTDLGRATLAGPEPSKLAKPKLKTLGPRLKPTNTQRPKPKE